MTTVHRLRDYGAETAIVLGSGLDSLVGDSGAVVPYKEFAEIPQPSVPGHVGQFVLGRIGNVPIIFAQGRVHLYEGFSAREVTAIVRVLAQSGIKQLILTNAAGSLNPKFKPGDWMMITDHINLTGTSPVISPPDFIDMTEAYSLQLRDKFREAAKKIGMTLHQGVYAGVVGPQYETPAEVKMLRSLGADAVGMSTVLEVIQARALGLEIAAFSCLTNLAAGLSTVKLSHREVLETGKKSAADFEKLLTAALLRSSMLKSFES
ncbi:MAG TPA: purine-nucleoside phosphorylase [Chthoniobacterales bacterium]|nr:purine-nucleoside phosphorylase [Chthoniobacterales bacterium]